MVDFLVIGHYLSVGNINMFSLVKNRKICFGYNRRGMYFDEGNINCCWFQNLIDYCPEELKLKKKYKDSDYKKFDNYDAIYIKKSEDIPVDYTGLMGVPVTFLEKWNYEQFEVIGFGMNGSGGDDMFAPIVEGDYKFRRILIKRK